MILETIAAALMLLAFLDMWLTFVCFVAALSAALIIAGLVGIARARLTQAAGTADAIVQGVE